MDKNAPKTLAPPWTFLTNHTHVLVCIAQEPDARIRDIALRVGVTERTVQKIIADLNESGYIAHRRKGRSNYYRVRPKQRLRHPIEKHCHIDVLLKLIVGTAQKIN